MSCLYKISFNDTNKVYIGITSRDVYKRFNEHCKSTTKSLIANAIRKHGVENTTLTILLESNDYDELLLLEQVSILEHGSITPNGYNITKGGEGVLGLNHSFESKLKMGISQKIRFLNDTERDNASIKTKNYYNINQDARLKMSEIKKEFYMKNPEKAIEHSNKMKNYYNINPDARLKIVESNKTRLISKQTLIKKSVSAALNWAIRLNRQFSYIEGFAQ